MFENEDRNATPAARKEVQGTTANPGAKLLALLSKSDDAHIVFFPPSYFLLAAGVGVFLGLVMLVVESRKASSTIWKRFRSRQSSPRAASLRCRSRSSATRMRKATAPRPRGSVSLGADIPGARAVRSDKGYFVVLGSAPAGETEALLAAARAKKAANDAVQPVLVEVK
jgi:hypothetical protein